MGENLIKEMLAHVGKKPQTNTILSSIRSALIEEPSLRLVIADYMHLIQNINWKLLDVDTLLKPIESIPSVKFENGKNSLSHLWPVQLGVMFAKLGLKIEFESLDGADLFIHDGDLDEFFPLSRGVRQGVEYKGIAIQCKAITSATKIKKRIKDASKQLESSEGGLIAIDISNLVFNYFKNQNVVSKNPLIINQVLNCGFEYFLNKCFDFFSKLPKAQIDNCAGMLVNSRVCISLPNEPESKLEFVIPGIHMRWNPDFSNSLVKRLGERHTLQTLYVNLLEGMPVGNMYVNNDDILKPKDGKKPSITITTITQIHSNKPENFTISGKIS